MSPAWNDLLSEGSEQTQISTITHGRRCLSSMLSLFARGCLEKPSRTNFPEALNHTPGLRQPECLLLGRDNGHLAPPDSHLWGSTQAAPSPPVLLRSLPTTGALSNFPHHPGASQDHRISSGPQQGTSPAGSGLGRGRIGRQERGSPAGKKGAKGKQVEPL